MEPWTACPCCKGDKPEHAIIQVKCARTGDGFRLRVPHEARYDSTGWGDLPRRQWKGADGSDRAGFEVSRGNAGVTLRDSAGALHRVDHGYFDDDRSDGSRVMPRRAVVRLTGAPSSKLESLQKGAAPKEGQRWITVHPNGADEKGVPILIGDNKDGTWSVVGGAGGKLHHLRLKNVKTEEEQADKAKVKAHERKAKEKVRKAGQGEGEKKSEKVAKDDVEAARLVAQRDFIAKVRKKLGGVDEDIDQDRISGLGGGARNLIMTRHHKKQLRQAVEAKDAAARKLIEAEVADRQDTQAVHRAAEDQSVAEPARELAQEELALRAQEEEERRGDLRANRLRQVAGKSEVGERASKAVEERLGKIDTDQVEKQLKDLGGRDDDGKVLRFEILPSEEIQRRALQSKHNAAILAKAAQGEVAASPVAQQVVQQTLKKLGLEGDPSKGVDDVLVQESLAREAARQIRRSEVQMARSIKIADIEGDEKEGGVAKAANAVAYSDLLGNIATSAATAKRMGLTDTERTPVQAAELAEIREILQEAATLRKKEAEFRAATKEAERGKYARAREAMDLKVRATDREVDLSVEDEVRRSLAENLRSFASRKRADYLQSAAAAHYDTIADVGLSIGGQRYIDRPTVDAIGMSNAALLMRHGMEEDGHATGDVLEALEKHHVAQLEPVTMDAIARAEKAIPNLHETITDVGSIEGALAQLHEHEANVRDAQEAVGSALGRLEATATLGQAFRQKLPDAMEIKGDAGAMDASLQWLHSLGLTNPATDYRVDYKEGTVSIPRTAWGKMLNRLPDEEVKRRAAAVQIKEGSQDTKGWLPPGIVSRPATSFTAPSAEAPVYGVPLDFTGGLEKAIADHAGSRLADGERPHEILHDLLDPQVRATAPTGYDDAVRAAFPLVDDKGQARKYDDFAQHFHGMAEKFMAAKYGDKAAPFHAQSVDVEDPHVQEAAFRALTSNPRATVAFKGTGELTSHEAGLLRDHFYERMGIDKGARVSQAQRDAAVAAIGPEPDPTKGTLSLFGGGGPSPEWRSWKASHEAVLAGHADKINKIIDGLGPRARPEQVEGLRAMIGATGASAWARYVDAHGSLEFAQRAMQDEIRDGFVKDFVAHHGRLTGQRLRTGVAEVTNRERHLVATGSHEEAAKLRAEGLAIHAKLRDRVGGQFAREGEGAVKAKHTRFMEQGTIAEQNQLRLVGSPGGPDAATRKPEPRAGERLTIGERAEADLGTVINRVGGGFDGKKVSLFPGLNMDGDRVHQQRVLKTFDANGHRLLAALGTGSGKSLISIGAFTQAHAKGEVSHAIYAVPKAVEDQFGGEMLRYTEPGKYKWAIGSSMGSYEERLAALKDDKTHMKVMTHEALRDTLTRMMADHHRGGDIEAMKRDLEGTNVGTRATWLRQAMDAHGIKPWLFYGDEAHRFTSRGEGATSGLHSVMTAASHPKVASHALFGTATPAKNDESEVYSMAAMVDPDKYGDRHQFMHNFGTDLANNPHAIRRELAHAVYTARIDPDTDRIDSDNPRIEPGKAGGLFGAAVPARKVAAGGPLPLAGAHKEAVDSVGKDYESARRGYRAGKPNVEASRRLSPASFEGQPPERHEEIARTLGPSLGILRESATRRAINQAPAEHNVKLQRLGEVVKHDVQEGTWTDRQGKANRGKPSIVFSDSLGDARLVHEHLASQGIRTALYHGGLTSREREAVRLGFQPDGGAAPKFDVVVATSAAEAGINMQRAKVVHHYDVPQTDKSHAQRSGRAYRQGQQGDVEVHNWHTDAEYEQQARRRLRRKAGLAQVLQSPLGKYDEHGVAGTYAQVLARKHQAAEIA